MAFHTGPLYHLKGRSENVVGDRETHPLMGLLDVVTAFVHDYEERNVEIPDATPAVVLGFLMEQNNLRQSDLAEDFGSQSNVSEVLNGKREINAPSGSRACEAIRSLHRGFHLNTPMRSFLTSKN